MNPFRTLIATFIFGFFLLYGSAISIIPNRASRLSARLRMNRRLARAFARAIGLRIATVVSSAKNCHATGRLILANHTSVLDVIALASLEEAIFVTSRDMAESLPIRWLVSVAGVALVERRNRDDRAAELENLEFLLREGRTIVLFPEATSTDGSEILRFRNGLLHAALRVPGVEIIPICLQYSTIGGNPVTFRNRHRLFLYGEMSVATHLLHLFTNPIIQLKVSYLPMQRADAYANSLELATHAETVIRETYRPITA